MLITNFTISNFKSISNITLDLSQINIFIGQNRSGKSSIQQAFGVLQQSVSNQIVWNGNTVNLESFKNVLNKKTTRQTISIRYGGISYASANLEEVLGIHRIKFGINYDIGENELENIDYGLQSNQINFQGSINLRNNGSDVHTLEAGGVKSSVRIQLRVKSPLQTSGTRISENISEKEREKISGAFTELLNIFNEQIENFIFVPVLRGFDSPTYHLTDKDPTSLPTGGGVSELARQAASSFAYNRHIERKVSDIMSKIIPDIKIEHRLSPQQVSVTSEDQYGEYNVSTEGFGLNQLCILFQQLVRANKNSTIFIEEPEIALHPAAHADVCNALIDEIQNESKQLVITTHSEHVLLGFLDAVLQKRLSPDTLKVYYFERVEGLTKVTPLKVTETGGIIGGLKGFFEADMKHLDNFLSAMKKK